LPDHVDDRFEWDIAKSDQTLRIHGFDFALACQIFESEPWQEFVDDRTEYGEERIRATGTIDGQWFHVVYTRRLHRLRIISARRATANEIDDYTQEYGL
jgi:uncharacterized protein